MKKALIIVLTLVLAQQIYAQWKFVHSFPGNEWSGHICFTSPDTGYRHLSVSTATQAHYEKFFRTDNGGYNWNEVISVTCGAWDNFGYPYAFFDNTTGYSIRMLEAGNNLIRTTSSGVGWTTLCYISPLPKAICPVGQNRAFIVSAIDDYYSVIRKFDEGSSYIVFSANDTILKEKMQFINDDIGFVNCRLVQENLYALMKTENMGYDWSVIFRSNTYIKDIEFVDESNGFLICSNNKYLYRTMNSGLYSWDSIMVNADTACSVIEFTDHEIGYVGCLDGKIYKTYNGGDNWILLEQVTDNPINEIISLNDSLLFVDIKLPYWNPVQYKLYKSSTAGIGYEINTTDVFCQGYEDGTLEILIQSGAPDTLISYSIDGGLSYQGGNLFTGLAPGDYNVHVRYDDTVILKAITTIDDLFVPLDLGPDTSISVAGSYELNAGPGYVEYLWNTGETSQKISISGSQYGPGSYEFWVLVLDSHDCQKSDTVGIIIYIASGISDLNCERDLKFTYDRNRKILSLFPDSPGCNSSIRFNFYNIQGKHQYYIEDQKSKPSYTIDVRDWPEGVYIGVLSKENKAIGNLKLVLY